MSVSEIDDGAVKEKPEAVVICRYVAGTCLETLERWMVYGVTCISPPVVLFPMAHSVSFELTKTEPVYSCDGNKDWKARVSGTV